MAIDFIIEKLDAVDDAMRSHYKEVDGKYVLDITGAIPKSEYDTKLAELETVQKLARSPEGKTYKEMFEGAQNANKAIRQERDGYKTEIGKWSEFTDVASIHAMQDELDALKAEGKKLTDVQQQRNDLLKANREYRDRENLLKNKEQELMAANQELLEFKTATQRKLDAADAESQIGEVVDAFKEANHKALKRNLVDRYRAGDLVRDETGKLVTNDGTQSLLDYAKETMEAYNLFNPSSPGRANPPSGAIPPSSARKTTIETLQGMFGPNTGA